MMPIAIYPVIALGTLGLKQCNTGVNARMSSAQYSVRSMSIRAMSVGGGNKCRTGKDWENWDEKVSKIAEKVQSRKDRLPNMTRDEAIEFISKVKQEGIENGSRRIAGNGKIITPSKDREWFLIEDDNNENGDFGTFFRNRKKDGKRRSIKETTNYINKFLNENY